MENNSDDKKTTPSPQYGATENIQGNGQHNLRDKATQAPIEGGPAKVTGEPVDNKDPAAASPPPPPSEVSDVPSEDISPGQNQSNPSAQPPGPPSFSSLFKKGFSLPALVDWMQQRLIQWLNGGIESSRSQQPLSLEEKEFLPSLLEIQETPASRNQHVILWSIVVFMAIAIIWSIVGKVSVVAIAPGRIIPDGDVKNIQSHQLAIVKNIYVQEGQHVKQGDVLVGLDTTISSFDLNSAEKTLRQKLLERKRLEAELSGKTDAFQETKNNNELIQRSLLENRLDGLHNKLEAARQDLRTKLADVDIAKADLDKAREQYSIVKDTEARLRGLRDEHFISEIEYLKTFKEFREAEGDINIKKQALEKAKYAAEQARTQISLVGNEWKKETLENLSKSDSDLPPAIRDAEKASYENDLQMLKAPVAGFINSLSVKNPGGVVSASQIITSIVPDNTPLIVEATLNNEDRAYIDVGQRVEVKVDTYPFQKYGVLPGHIIWISTNSDASNYATAQQQESPEERQAAGDSKITNPQDSVPHYKIRIAINQPIPQQFNLKAGMSVQADVQTDSRRVIEFILSPVVKGFNRAFSVR